MARKKRKSTRRTPPLRRRRRKAPATEQSAKNSTRAKGASSTPELEKAYRYMRAGLSQKLAAKSAGVSVKRLREFLRKNRLARFRVRKWRFTDKRRRRVVAITTRGEKEIVVRGFEPASWAMAHRNAVREFRDTNDASLLAPFEGVSITDERGRNHKLETRPNALYRQSSAGGEQYEQIYRLVT